MHDATIRAEVQAFTTKQGVDNTFAEAVRQQGTLDGQNVQVKDAATALANAAEEATFAASEKVEKKLAERKAGSKEALRASSTELAEKLVNMLAEPQAARKLHEFMDAMRKMGDASTEQEIRNLVSRYFEDPAEQFAALSFAEKEFAKDPAKEGLVAKIAEAKARLIAETGMLVRSGINIAADVLEFARKGLGGREELRDLYRFTLLGGQPIDRVYARILERYDAARFGEVLEFLLRAAGSDLDGKLLGSSIEPSQLKCAMDDIYHVQSLGNLHRALGEVLDTTRRLYGEAA
jgi:type III secretion protein W